MLDNQGLAISIPAKELAGVQVPASLFGMDRLLAANISPELRCALRQIDALHADSDTRPVFIARPELFVVGSALDWLYEKLGTIRDHLCLSDGSAIRPIPGMRNHVFFYGLGRRADADALRSLQKRIPELFSTLDSQINTALRFRHATKSYLPPTVILHRSKNDDFVPAACFKFYLNRQSMEDSVAHMLKSAVDNIPWQLSSTLVPITETAVSDHDFMHYISILIERGYFDPNGSIVLRLPHGQGDGAEIASRLRCLVAGLLAVPSQIPRVVADNIFVVTEDIDPSEARQRSDERGLVLHDTFDFWRWTPAAYAAYNWIDILPRRGHHHPRALASMLLQVYGDQVQIIRHTCPGP